MLSLILSKRVVTVVGIPCEIALSWIQHDSTDDRWWVLCQKQVSRTWTSNYIPQYLWDVISCHNTNTPEVIRGPELMMTKFHNVV